MFMWWTTRVLVLEGNAGYLLELRKKLPVEQSINRKMSAINKFKLAANIA